MILNDCCRHASVYGWCHRNFSKSITSAVNTNSAILRQFRLWLALNCIDTTITRAVVSLSYYNTLDSQFHMLQVTLKPFVIGCKIWLAAPPRAADYSKRYRKYWKQHRQSPQLELSFTVIHTTPALGNYIEISIYSKACSCRPWIQLFWSLSVIKADPRRYQCTFFYGNRNRLVSILL